MAEAGVKAGDPTTCRMSDNCPQLGCDYRTWYQEKRKADGRERTRRCRAKKASTEAIIDRAAVKAIQEAEPKFITTSWRHTQKISATLARQIGTFAANRLKSHGVEVQNLSILKFLGQPILHTMVPAFLRDIDGIKLRHGVVSSLKEGMQSHLVGLRKANTVLAKDIVCTFAAGSGVGSSRGVAGMLGIDRRNIKKAVERRILLDTRQDAFWLRRRETRRSDSLPESVKQLVKDWWTTETTISPNRKDVLRKRIAPKVYEEHQTHYLQVSQLEFFTAFRLKHPEVTCGLRSFEGLKPWWIRRLKNWNTCCCRYHQELSDLRDGLNNMRLDSHGIHKQCSCNCIVCANPLDVTRGSGCDAHHEVYQRLTHLWSSVLCNKGELDMWYRRECLLGECTSCGVHNLRICPIEASTETLIKWKRTGYEVIGQTEDGKPKKAIKIFYCESNPLQMLDYLKPKLSEFILHNYVATWQDLQFKELFSSVPENTIISCIDFSENYSMKIQNEIQSLHWRSEQITVLVHITYRLNPEWTSSNGLPYLLKETHYYISDEKIHDSLYVQYCFMLHWDYMKSDGFLPTNHIVWSDGCSGQFKSSRAWFFISKYPSLTLCEDLPEGCHMLWNYFASGHGKGEVDGAGALLKREVCKEKIKPNGQKLQNASEVVQFLKEESNKYNAGHAGVRQDVTKFFWEIKVGAVKRSDKKEAQTIPGSRAMHQARSLSCKDPTLIQFRQLSCFCVACLDPNSQFQCYQKSHVTDWTLKRIRPKRVTQVRQITDPESEDEDEDEWESRHHPGYSESIRVGFNIAVQADSDNDESFWIMLVTKGTHLVTEAFTDSDGNSFFPSESLVCGYWYERYRPGSRTYMLRDDKPEAFVHRHAVLLSDFCLPPTAHQLKGNFGSFELRDDVLDRIDSAIQIAQLLE